MRSCTAVCVAAERIETSSPPCPSQKATAFAQVYPPPSPASMKRPWKGVSGGERGGAGGEGGGGEGGGGEGGGEGEGELVQASGSAAAIAKRAARMETRRNSQFPKSPVLALMLPLRYGARRLSKFSYAVVRCWRGIFLNITVCRSCGTTHHDLQTNTIHPL